MGNSPRFSLANSHVVGSGTLVVTDNVQPANEFFGGPTIGSDATPSFRALTDLDFPLLNDSGSYLIDGGERVWVSGYTYLVSAANYVILGGRYRSDQTSITLAAAHATLDRIDLVVLNTSNAVAVITGTPASNPAQPSYDPQTQFPLSFILVTAL